MDEEFETVELEYSEDDILYYLEDEEGREIGFAIEEEGREVEYFYEGFEAGNYEALAEPNDEAVELEISEDDILYYLVDEDDNELGFVIMENGQEVECWYEDEAPDATAPSPASPASPASATAASPSPSPSPASTGAKDEAPTSTLGKLAAIAGHEGNKARRAAKAQIGKIQDATGAGIDKAADAIESGGKKLKQKSDEADLGITREEVTEITADLNAIAKEGAETAKELKEAYDDIMDSYGFLLPKKGRRR